jgi:hypothetical protein
MNKAIRSQTQKQPQIWGQFLGTKLWPCDSNKNTPTRCEKTTAAGQAPHRKVTPRTRETDTKTTNPCPGKRPYEPPATTHTSNSNRPETPTLLNH